MRQRWLINRASVSLIIWPLSRLSKLRLLRNRKLLLASLHIKWDIALIYVWLLRDQWLVFAFIFISHIACLPFPHPAVEKRGWVVVIITDFGIKNIGRALPDVWLRFLFLDPFTWYYWQNAFLCLMAWVSRSDPFFFSRRVFYP